MRCIACNKLLDDLESTNKDLKTGEYLDMCRYCLHAANITSELEDTIEDREGWESIRDDYDGGSYEGVEGPIDYGDEL